MHVVLACALCASLPVVGCRANKGDGGVSAGGREIDRGSMHDFPPITLDSSGDEHVIVMQAPHPGWGLELDAVRPARDGKLVFASARMPDPDRMYPQVITPMRLGTTVPASDKMELVVRLISHDDEVAGPYRPAAEAE